MRNTEGAATKDNTGEGAATHNGRLRKTEGEGAATWAIFASMRNVTNAKIQTGSAATIKKKS